MNNKRFKLMCLRSFRVFEKIRFCINYARSLGIELFDIYIRRLINALNAEQ